MDIALKQRLVGATILIALAVIFLPLLLDGDNSGGQSTRSIEIPERPEVDFKTRRLPIGDHAPEQAAEKPQPQAPEPQEFEAPEAEKSSKQQNTPDEPVADPVSDAGTEPVVNEPEVAEVAAPSPPGPAATADGSWLVQVGSFGSLENANRLGSQLDELGYAAMLEAGGGTSNTLVRVKIGPFKSEADAGDAAQRVRAAIPGLTPRVLSTGAGSAPVSTPAAGWVVQLGSFSATENAAKLSASLRQQGFTVFTDKTGTGSGAVYKVRTGPVAERADAEGLRDRIRARSGTQGMVVNLSEQ